MYKILGVNLYLLEIMERINDEIMYIRDVDGLSKFASLETTTGQEHFIISINVITQAADGTMDVIRTCTSGKLGITLAGDGNDIEDA